MTKMKTKKQKGGGQKKKTEKIRGEKRKEQHCLSP